MAKANITYKYFITEEKALRATLHYNSNEDSLTYDYSGYIKDASCFTLGIGYQKFYRSGKLKPTLYSDLSYVSEDFYEVDLNGLFTYSSDYTAVGFRISGGAGLRYEFNPKWALAYEADLRLQIRRMDGFITLRGHKTSWSNAIITNLKFDPISNFSVNFRL